MAAKIQLTDVLITVPATTYERGPYTDRFGHKHKATKVHRDASKRHIKRKRGKKKTPKNKRFFKPGAHSGWKKNMPPKERRALVLKAHKGNLLAASRAKQELANVSTDPATIRAAQADAKYFLRLYHREK